MSPALFLAWLKSTLLLFSSWPSLVALALVLWSLVLGSPTLSRPVPLPCHRLVAPRALAPVAGPVVGGLGAAGLIAPRALALDAGPTDEGLVVAGLVAHRALAPVAGPAVDGLGVSALKSPAVGPSPVLQSLVSKSPPPPLPPSSRAPWFSSLSSPKPRSRPPAPFSPRSLSTSRSPRLAAMPCPRWCRSPGSVPVCQCHVPPSPLYVLSSLLVNHPDKALGESVIVGWYKKTMTAFSVTTKV